MCNNFNVVFVEANCWVKRNHLARDGRHLNNGGSFLLGKLFSAVFDAVLHSICVTSSVFSEVMSDTEKIGRFSQPDELSGLEKETNSSFLEEGPRGAL